MQILFANYGPQLLIVDSADFDGTNDWMLRGAGLDGAADSKTGILSCWCRIDGGDAATRRFFNGTSAGAILGPRFGVNTANKFEMTLVNSAATEILKQNSTTAYTAGATWLHLLTSWDLANTTAHLYVNDVSDQTVTVGPTDDTVDYTIADWAVGSAITGGANIYNGCLAELYFAPGQYLDFSIVANRRKFISSSGKPVFLGVDGSSPTGTSPIVYQRVADGAAVATFATNLGTGGDFTITGTLDTGSTSPSD